MRRQYGAGGPGSIVAFALWLVVVTPSIAAGSERLICALVPHFKDEYWLSVGYGLEQEAARQGFALELFEAGGYGGRAQQIAQLSQCVQGGADAIVIAAVTSDHPDLLEAIGQVARQVPVYGVVNALRAEGLRGWVGVDWAEMGGTVGRYLARLHPAGSAPQTAVLISGPAGAGWTAQLEGGFRAGLAGSAVTIVAVFGADTGLRQQLALVETALEQFPDVDYLIGSAPAVEAAIGVFATLPRANAPRLLSTYISHTVLRGLMNGGIEAAAFDDPVAQGRGVIDMAARGFTQATSGGREGPQIVLLTPQSEGLAAIQLSPAEYFPSME